MKIFKAIKDAFRFITSPELTMLEQRLKREQEMHLRVTGLLGRINHTIKLLRVSRRANDIDETLFDQLYKLRQSIEDQADAWHENCMKTVGYIAMYEDLEAGKEILSDNEYETFERLIRSARGEIIAKINRQ